jgi:hypothetical protein
MLNLKRIAFGFFVAVTLVMPMVASAPGIAVSLSANQGAAGFNDKMLILHKGKELCVDWWAWPGHMIQHGDTLLGSCDVP